MKFQFDKKALIIAILCVVTFLCFSYTRHNQFTNWDDDWYVTNDPYIKALTAENLKIIFTQDITRNNYHPLCMLSLAINYYFSGMNPAPYYLTNVAIHILNVVLVFLLFIQLCRLIKLDDNKGLFVAGFGALWFGIHPMHVESVAWIAERKDVLYTFFYLLGLLAYLKYLGTEQRKWFWWTLAAFIASCLSKPMAVVFPLSLICVDVLAGKKIDLKLAMNKWLFFALSLFFGGLAFYTQNKTGAVASFSTLSLAERFIFASYGFVMYISKLFNPTYLSTFYPYPYRYVGGNLPSIYYISPLLTLSIIIVPLVYTWYKQRSHFRIVLFGMGFFIANIIFVLQFISVGAAIMSDRYSYVAYIGLLFLLPYAIVQITGNNNTLRNVVIAGLSGASIWLGYTTYERTYVWHDAETLLTDAITKYPYRALLSYKWRGHYYFGKGEYDKALADYNVLVTLHVADAKVLEKIARINAMAGSNAIIPGATPAGNKIDPTYSTHLDSTYCYIRKKDSINAFRQYLAALRGNTSVEREYAKAAFKNVQDGQNAVAEMQYDILLKISTSNPYYYFYRGVTRFSQSNIKAAITDWEVAVKMPEKETQQSAAYNLAVAYDTTGKPDKAWQYVQMAKAAGYQVKDDYYMKLKKKAGK